MASIIHGQNGHRSVQFKGPNGKRQTIRLGKVTEQQAVDFRQSVERLLAAQAMGQAPDLPTAQWVGRLGQKLHDRLAAAGLVGARRVATLGQLFEEFDKTINVKPLTKAHLKVVKDNLRQFFGESTLLTAITEADAQRFRTWISQHGTADGGPLASTTVSRRCRRAMQIFRLAVKKRWLQDSPFQGMSGWNEVNRDRDFLVSKEVTEKVLGEISSVEFRGVVVLARYGGLRCPSEILPMTWSQVNWFHNLLIVKSPKTAHHEDQAQRTVPMFPEVKAILNELWDHQESGTLIFPNLQVTAAALKNRLEAACRASGIALWPKPWQNMRSTRVTELAEVFPIQVVASWMGHSPMVAVRHYVQVSQEHLDRAIAGFDKLGKGVRQTSETQENLTQKPEIPSRDPGVFRKPS